MKASALDLLIDSELSEGELISALIELECRRKGLDTYRATPSIIVASDAKQQAMFHRSVGPSVTRASELLLWNKWATKQLLNAHELRTPSAHRFHHSERSEAETWAEQHDWNIVLKPVGSSKGRGFFGNCKNRATFREAWESLSADRRARRSGILVEKHQKGFDARFYVVGEEIAGVIQRSPAQVEGDGEHSIRCLIAKANAHRMSNPHFRSRLIAEDATLMAELAQQGLDLDTVPSAGSRVRLRRNANLSTGGTLLDKTDDCHPAWNELVARVSMAVAPLAQYALDVMVQSVSESPWKQDYGIIELEGDPGVSNIHLPLAGAGRNVCGRIVEFYFGTEGHCFFGDGLMGQDLIDYRRMHGLGFDTLAEIVRGIETLRLDGQRGVADRDSPNAEAPRPASPVPQPTLPPSSTGILERQAGAFDVGRGTASETVSEAGTRDVSTTDGYGIRAYRFAIHGHVVGVGFRRWASRVARENDLVGWIRNAGAEVEGLISGLDSNCQQFIGLCLQGPSRARVDGVRVSRVDLPDLGRFRRRRTVPGPARTAVGD